MKKSFLLISIFVLCVSIFFAQEYIMNDKAAHSSLTGNYFLNYLSGGDWDNGYIALSVSTIIDFYFYGKKVNYIRIWTNGYVTFGFGSPPSDYSDYSNETIPSVSQPNGYVAPWWDDWDLTNHGFISYNNYLSTYLVICWGGVQHKDDPISGYTFKVILYSRNDPDFPNCIRFVYDDTDSGNGAYDHAVSGTVGIEHPTGYQGEKFTYNVSEVANGQAILFTPYVPIYDSTDFWATDGGKPDLLVFRPDDGIWFKRSNDGASTHVFHYGQRGDVPLPGDYDGDGDADEAVLRPDTYTWFGNDPTFVKQWGQEGDIPLAADFTGDGQTDLVIFRPSEGSWFIHDLATTSSSFINWGTGGDIPLPADYDNDGKADAAVYRPSNNTWFIRKSSNPADYWIVAWGTEGDIPMPANSQGAPYATLTIYRPSNGYWFNKNQWNGATMVPFSYGLDRDHPVPNDWNAGGASDAAVFRPSDGRWYINYGSNLIPWGTLGDKPRCRRSFSIVAPGGGTSDNENK